MIVGVVNKKGINSKVMGSVINYTLSRGDIRVKILLDLNKRNLIAYTESKPEGEIVVNDLPKDGIFYPAILNKTQKVSNNVKL